MYRYLLVTLFVVLFSGNVWSQATLTAEAFAEVIDALTANEDEALNFGSFSTGSSGGTITISTDGLRSVQGTAVTAGDTYSPGRFVVSGASGASFTIKLPDEAAILVHEESGETMEVSDWSSDPSSGDAATLTDGSRIVSIGATLNVGSIDENPVGQYAGTFTITFAYN